MKQSIGRASAASYRIAPARPIAGTGAGARTWARAHLGALAAVALLASCATTPVTGTKSFNLFSHDQDVALGREAYAQVLSENTVIQSGPELQRVKRVMNRLVAAADDPGYEWEVNLIDDPSVVNAFALPGGKMAVYTGMLAACPTDDALAVVMGHEIGHVVARHGTQRMSVSAGANMVLQAADLNELGGVTQTLVGVLYAPYGREHESESDHIGIIYMARAGYDPHAAPAFWRSLSANEGEVGEPSGLAGTIQSYLATHPSHATRIRDLEKLLPEALAEQRRR